MVNPSTPLVYYSLCVKCQLTYFFQKLYGELERKDGYYGDVTRKKLQIDWRDAPQPVKINVKLLCGVGNKLPGKFIQ